MATYKLETYNNYLYYILGKYDDIDWNDEIKKDEFMPLKFLEEEIDIKLDKLVIYFSHLK